MNPEFIGTSGYIGEEIYEPKLEYLGNSQTYSRRSVNLGEGNLFGRIPSEEAWGPRTGEETYDEAKWIGYSGDTHRIFSLPSHFSNDADEGNSTLQTLLTKHNSFQSLSKQDSGGHCAGYSQPFDIYRRFPSPLSQDDVDSNRLSRLQSEDVPYSQRPFSLPISLGHSDSFSVCDPCGTSNDLPASHTKGTKGTKGSKGSILTKGTKGCRKSMRFTGELPMDVTNMHTKNCPLPSDSSFLSGAPYHSAYRSEGDIYYPRTNDFLCTPIPNLQKRSSIHSSGKSESHEPSGKPQAGDEEVDTCLLNCEALLQLLLQISKCYNLKKLRFTMLCSTREVNSHAAPNAKLCYDYLNSGSCKREQATGSCKYRHLASDHIDTIMDKIFSGKMRVSLIQCDHNHYYVLEMPGYNSKYPGELNQYAPITADLCLEYNLTGKCSEEARGGHCHLRHLASCHPERIALLYLHGMLSEEEAAIWHLSPCSDNEVNPFSNPKENLCYDFQNHSYCKRNREGKICRFRHLLSDHEDAIRDRKKMNNRHTKGDCV